MTLDIDLARHELSLTSVHDRNRQHWTVTNDMRRATCEEIGCLDYRTGWRIRIDALKPEDLAAMRMSGRHFTVLDVSADEHWWLFEAGQQCFKAAAHQAPVGRPELFLVGDRGDVRTYDRGDQFAEDCAVHTTRITDKIMEG